MKTMMICVDDDFSKIIFNKISSTVNIEKVIIEKKISSKLLIKNRIKKLGLLKVVGQVLFILFSKVMRKVSSKRIIEIKEENQLNTSKIPLDLIERVDTVNSNEVIKLLRDHKPDVVIVNGTRIIKKDILEATDKLFLNIHTGITPKYRGVHGGYWALFNDDILNCGVTLHRIDNGVDTGDIIGQSKIEPTSKDNYITYPYLQISKGIKLLKSALENLQEGELKFYQRKDLESKQWYHPSIIDYLKGFIIKGVK